ncbi:MAG: type II toxin-antitoxin system RelE family toxin [Candidatus Aminicenantales bacterium]
MSWSIRVSSTAEKYFKKLDKKLQRKMRERLQALSRQQNPLENIQVKALTGELKGFYRLRIGKYRIIFALLEEKKVIAVVNIIPRGNAY